MSRFCPLVAKVFSQAIKVCAALIRLLIEVMLKLFSLWRGFF